jgi:hypothetical protein
MKLSLKIFDEIYAEREYQKKRWGDELDDKYNTPLMWVAYLTQYATKWITGSFLPFDRKVTDSFRSSMIKVATLAIAAVESLDRQREANGKAFYEKE